MKGVLPIPKRPNGKANIMTELTVDNNGVSGFNADALDRLDLGERESPRVSDIAWDPFTQKWQVRVILEEWNNPSRRVEGGVIQHRVLSEVLFMSPIRKECIEWEMNNEPMIRRMAGV